MSHIKVSCTQRFLHSQCYVRHCWKSLSADTCKQLGFGISFCFIPEQLPKPWIVTVMQLKKQPGQICTNWLLGWHLHPHVLDVIQIITNTFEMMCNILDIQEHVSDKDVQHNGWPLNMYQFALVVVNRRLTLRKNYSWTKMEHAHTKTTGTHAHTHPPQNISATKTWKKAELERGKTPENAATIDMCKPRISRSKYNPQRCHCNVPSTLSTVYPTICQRFCFCDMWFRITKRTGKTAVEKKAWMHEAKTSHISPPKPPAPK